MTYKKIPIMKKIWVCKNCNCRIKKLNWLMEKPKICYNCKGKDFI